MSDAQLLAVQPWTSSLTSLSFHFLISKMGHLPDLSVGEVPSTCCMVQLATAAQGGAWGMAVLSAYLIDNELSLPEFLEKKVFGQAEILTAYPNETEALGFEKYLENYVAALKTQRDAYKYY